MLSLFKKRREPLRDLKDAIGEQELPSFPGVIMTALGKVRDHDSANSEIADILSTDPGFSAKLLGTVNSAAFSLRHRVGSVHHAISLLGRSQLESMLISLAVRDALPSSPKRGFNSSRFWTTAARRASTARALAERIEPSKASESFTASLLQDMALPVLASVRESDYGQVLEDWHGGTDDLAEMERKVFGWDHAAVASHMCSEWHFPADLTQAIAGHHDGLDDEPIELPVVRLVSVLREVNEATGVEQLIETTHSTYGIKKDELADAVEISFDRAEEIAQLFR